MKSDFLKECLSDITQQAKSAIPIDQFMTEYCVFCLNNQCSRSGSSNMAFERRAKNWESNLFINVPRVSDSDPSYDSIRSKWYRPPTSQVVTENKPVVQNKAPAPQVVVTPSQTKAKKPKTKKPKPRSKKTATTKSAGSKKNVPVTAEETRSEPVVPEPPTEQKAQENTVSSLKNNTGWDNAGYVGEPESQDVVIKPGESFTFG
jgi:hypothetical protein